jgi:hypothetical protein
MANEPTKDYIIMRRDYYNELKLDLQRVITSMTLDEAHGHGAAILGKLIDKYDVDLSPALRHDPNEILAKLRQGGNRP